MAKQFVILCSAQRLTFQDKNDASDGVAPYFAFGLNLSAAIGVDDKATLPTSEEVRALRPWRWTGIEDVQAFTLTSAGPKFFSCKVIPLPSSVPDIDWDTLGKQLDLEYPETDPDLSVTTWLIPDATASTPRKVDRNVVFNLNPAPKSAQRKPWHASILQLSTYPYPIPQKLNLSFIVKVPQSEIADPAQPLYLSPIIKADTDPAKLFFAADTKPLAQPPQQVDARGVYGWKYDHPTVAGLDIYAYLTPVVVKQTTPLPTTYIDRSTGWVKSSASDDFFEEDWRAYLESKMGEAFDLSECLIDFLRDKVSGSFLADDLVNPSALFTKLKDAQDPLAIYLRGRLSDSTRQLLQQFAGPNNVNPLLLEALINEFNELVRGPSIYEAERFKQVHLSEETKSLIAQPSPGKDLIRLNHRLIAESYPNEIASPLKPEIMPFFQRLVICTLRDLAGTGLLPSIDGNTLPDDLLGPDLAQKLPPNKLGQLRAVEKELFDTLINPTNTPNGPQDPANQLDHKWRRFIAETVPQVANLGVLDPINWERNRQPEECLADLEQLHKTLMDKQNLHALVQGQWQKIFDSIKLNGWDAESINKLEELKKRLGELGPDFNYRARLARCSLGPIWKALRRISANDISQPLDIKGLFPGLMASHLECRLKLNPEVPDVSQADYDIIYFPECRGDENTGLLNQIIAHVKNRALAIREGVIPAKGHADKPTDVPHSVSLQAHLTTMIPPEAVQQSPEQSAFNDVLNDIAGVLVFMRDPSENVWYCLNYARAIVRGATADRINAVAVPSRINYQNGLSQSLITYNNVPLVAQSPLAKIPLTNHNTRIEPKTGASNAEHKEPLIKYDYYKDPLNPEDPRSKIKALVFRDEKMNYESIICSVSVSGALPRELTVRNNPWEINQTQLSHLINPGAGLLRSFSYLRKVRVGQIRSKNFKFTPGKNFPASGEGNPLNLPKVPDRVHPRALELPAVSDQKGEPRVLGDKLPLLLLVPETEAGWSGPQSSFEFRLRKPATDVETWHRWVNQGTTNAAWRSGVLADYYKVSEANRNLPADMVPQDISFDDPSVSGFYVQVQRFDLDGSLSEVPVKPSPAITIPPKPVTQTMNDVQSDPLKVVCHGSSAGEGASYSGGTLTLNCLKGKIYWVRIYASIKTADRPRFAKFFDQEFQPVGHDLLLASPFELLVETATKDLPKDEEVWRSLTPAFVSGEGDDKGDRIEVSLKSADPLFRHVHRAELIRQAWYWRGRETQPFPDLNNQPKDFVNPDLFDPDSASTDPGLSVKVKTWEEFEFAGRDAGDFTILDFKSVSDTGVAPRIGPPKTPAPKNANNSKAKAAANPAEVKDDRTLFVHTEQLTPERSKQPASDRSSEKGDLRAHYYRFSARVYSRYEGIIENAEERFVEAVNPKLDKKDSLAKWRRLFVPCRRRETPPVPHIKLIVPLTQNIAENTPQHKRSPGLLVVLNETWHEFGGLGESILAEVETLADPHNPSMTSETPVPTGGPPNPAQPIPDPCPLLDANGKPIPATNTFYFELGPDPIVSGSSNPLVAKSDDPNRKLSTASLENIRGPVGHTHDTIDEGAFFVATSFIIPAPQITTGKGAPPDFEDLAWYMAKIRLQRIVRLKGRESTDPSAIIRSAFAEPQWVQYLPDFSLFSNTLDVGRLRFKASPMPGGPPPVTEINVVTEADNVVKGSDLSGPNEKSNAVFSILLLLTRTAYDASGRRSQEVYVGIFSPKADGNWNLIDGDTSREALHALASNNQVRFRARILELQAVPSGVALEGRFKTSQELFDLLFAFNTDDDSKGPRIDDLKRPRIVRISQPIEDFREPAGPKEDQPRRSAKPGIKQNA
jgi:hypothetical protein